MKDGAFYPILLSSVVVIGLIFGFSYGYDFGDITKKSSFVDRAGEGFSVPACASSGGDGETCDNGNSIVTFTWTDDGSEEGVSCLEVWIRVNIAGDVSTSFVVAEDLPCSGSYVWTNASNDTTYDYYIRYKRLVDTAGPDAGTIRIFPDANGKLGHVILSGSLTTPVCGGFSPDYSLSATPPGIFANISGSSQVTSSASKIQVTPFGGFSSNISLSSNAGSVIAGADDDFTDNTLRCNNPPSCSNEYTNGSNFTIDIPPNTSPGSYVITITGSGGALPPRTVSVTLSVAISDPGFIEVLRPIFEALAAGGI